MLNLLINPNSIQMIETKKRILVIDDDIDLLMLLERRLQKENYEVETAVSLHEAEDTIEYFSPHLILLDININGDDGRQLCWKIKNDEQYSDIKIIIMSGYDFDTGRAILFGADELLAKPLHADYLLHRIALHLSNEAFNALAIPFDNL